MSISLAATAFGTITLHEKVDVLAGQLYAQQLRIDPTVSDAPGSAHTPASVERYLKRARAGGAVAVDYTDKVNGIGRLSIRVAGLKDGETCITQAHPGDGGNQFKATICNRYYQDVDIDKCHPVLLHQICAFEGIDMPVLQRYITEFDSLVEATGLPKKAFKKLVFATVMYDLSNLSPAQLEKKADDAGAKSFPPLLLQMRTELLAATNTLLERYPAYMAHAQERKGRSYFNLRGTALSYLVQTAEKKCLVSLLNYFTQAGVTVGALIHDGVHAELSGPHPVHLTAGAACIKEVTGFGVTLSYKPWTVPACMEEATVAPDTVAQAEMVLETLKGRVLRCDGRLWFCDETRRWISGDKEVDRLVTNHVGTLTIYVQQQSGLVCVSRQAMTMLQIAKAVQRMAPNDPHFLKRMYEQTMGRLVFEDGYFDFGAKEFVREPIEHMSRVPRPFPKRIERDVREVRERLLEPILGDIEGAFMNYLARGLAGCVDDKSWAAGLGERNSGKSVLCTLAELAFGRDIVCTVNSESFLCSKNSDGDAAKGLGFLMPAEWARLVVTNEIAIKDAVLNGAALKKMASGGDTVSARLLHQNASSFRIQGRLLMCANDLPEVAPADAKSTAVMFSFPSCFVEKGDKRLGTHSLYRQGDDGIKALCRQECIQGAFIHLLMDSYGSPIISDAMKVMQNEFRSGDDRTRFLELIVITDNDDDVLSAAELAAMVRKHNLCVTALAYNRWLETAGAKRGREMHNGKRQTVVKRVKRHHDVMANELTRSPGDSSLASSISSIEAMARGF